MTLKEYLDNRNSATYNKKIRILNQKTRKNCGNCVNNFNSAVVSTKVTEKYLFIFISPIDK